MRGRGERDTVLVVLLVAIFVSQVILALGIGLAAGWILHRQEMIESEASRARRAMERRVEQSQRTHAWSVALYERLSARGWEIPPPPSDTVE